MWKRKWVFDKRRRERNRRTNAVRGGLVLVKEKEGVLTQRERGNPKRVEWEFHEWTKRSWGMEGRVFLVLEGKWWRDWLKRLPLKTALQREKKKYLDEEKSHIRLGEENPNASSYE